MRSIWNGSISFGLVTIPIRLYSGSEERGIDLDMLDKHDHARIRYKRVNEDTGKEVEWGDIVKGFKTENGYVILEDEDFKKANYQKSETIDIESFVEESEVADILYKKPYFVEPQKGAGKPYNLFRDALKKTKKLGVATFVLRQRENLCLLGVYKDILVLHLIRFAHEIRNPEELNITDAKVSKKEVDMAISLIDQYSEPFEFEKYSDNYSDQLMKIIEDKAAGKTTKVKKIKTTPTAADDLMKKLKESLERKKKNVA